MEKFLVVRFSSLGDIVLASVVTKQLRQRFPGCRITFLTKSKYASLAELLSGVDRVIDCGLRSNFILLLQRVGQEKFDCLIDLHSNWRSFWVRRLTPAKNKIKYSNHRLKRLLMVKFPSLSIDPLFVTELYLQALSSLQIPLGDTSPELVLKSEDHMKAEEFLGSRGIPPRVFLVGIAPGARWQTKRWHPERFVQVSRQLQDNHGGRVILFGNEEEADLLDDLVCEIPGSVTAKDLDFGLLAALIGKCSLLISNDSGLMHISSALGVPTIAIFGPTHPKLGFAPQGLKNAVLTANQPCSPCSLHGEKRCFQPARFCMDNISSEAVLKAAAAVLQKNPVALVNHEK